MLRGNWRGAALGSGSDVWKYWAELRAGAISAQDWQEIEQGIARSPGHCMTMGTASTMTSAAEALGMTLPGAASIPAADSRHAVMAVMTGKRIVDMVWDDLKPLDVIGADSIRNAVAAVLAIGGSRLAPARSTVRRSEPMSKGRLSSTKTSSGRSTIRWSLPTASPFCAATSLRTGRSSSRLPPKRACTSTWERRSSSRITTTWLRALTIPISTSTRIRCSS